MVERLVPLLPSAEGSAFRCRLDRPSRTIRLTGELDVATVPLLARAAARARRAFAPGVVTLDLTNLSFITAAGLGAVVRLHNDHRERSDGLRLIGMTQWVSRVFELGGLGQYTEAGQAA